MVDLSFMPSILSMNNKIEKHLLEKHLLSMNNEVKDVKTMEMIVSWLDMFKSWFLTEKQCQGLHISLWKGKWAGSICLNLNSWHKDNVNVHIFHCDEDTKRAQYVYILILDIKTKSTIIHFIVIRIVRWLNMFKSWFLTQK